jgi:large subunit ribosomal protein L10
VREEKQLLLDEIKEKLEGAETFLLTRYTGLKANDASAFRSALRATSSELEVVRKRVLLKAAEAAGIEIDTALLKGHIALVTSTGDSVSATKAVFAFGNENGGTVEVLAGQVAGVLYNAEQIEKLSKLPNLDTMRAQFLGLLEAPMAQTLSVMEALLTSIMHLLENKSKQIS